MTRFGTPLLSHVQVSSTQDLLRELASQGADPGTVVSAEHQTKGRGRQGRTWFSLPAPQLYFSLLLQPDIELSKTPLLSIAAGIAVAVAIEQEGIPNVGIKWPNDVFLSGKKVSGVLAESFPSPAGKQIALGVGVNISGSESDFPKELSGQATTLSLHSKKAIDPIHLRTLILAGFERLYELVISSKVEMIQEEFRKRWIYSGQLLQVTVGGKKVEGRSEGIDSDGALLLRISPQEEIRIVSGEIIPL